MFIKRNHNPIVHRILLGYLKIPSNYMVSTLRAT